MLNLLFALNILLIAHLQKLANTTFATKTKNYFTKHNKCKLNFHYCSLILKIKNMKTTVILCCLCVVGLLLSSCDPNGLNNDTNNYWEQNALVRMHLKGKVKTVTINEYNTEVIQFSESGLINSRTTSSTGEYASTTQITNKYSANGNLARTITETNYNSTTTKDTVEYDYGTHGKYVPHFGFHMWMSGLTPNLTAIISSYSRTDFVFKGNNLLMIITNYSTSKKDTTTFAYNGKYPVSTETSWSFVENLTYADNGMFKTYTEGFKNENNRTTRVYTFKADSEFQLLDSESETYVDNSNPANNSSSITSYTYNEEKDIIKMTRGEYTEEYINYVYDAKGNWTSRQLKSRNDASSAWTTNNPVTRTIVYW